MRCECIHRVHLRRHDIAGLDDQSDLRDSRQEDQDHIQPGEQSTLKGDPGQTQDARNDQLYSLDHARRISAEFVHEVDMLERIPKREEGKERQCPRRIQAITSYECPQPCPRKACQADEN